MDARSETPLASLGDPATRSQGITLLAVANIVLGALEVFGYTGMLLFGLLWFAVIHSSLKAHSPKDEVLIYSIMGVSGMMFLSGVLKIVTGIGMLLRRRWARNVTLILGVLEFLPGLFFIVSGVLLIGDLPDKNPGNLILFAVLSSLPPLIHWSYCVMVFATLLRKRIANEFS